MAVFQINKGINKPIEFKGLKAQYIGYLAAGLVSLLIAFAVMYISGVPLLIAVPLIAGSTSALFYLSFKGSNVYGEHGLMKKMAVRKLPGYIKFDTRHIFLHLKK